MHRECDRILRDLGNQVYTEIRGDCPPESTLYELAAGILDDDTANRILEHIVQCTHWEAMSEYVLPGGNPYFLSECRAIGDEIYKLSR
jgi:hypothetical protein